MDNSVELADHFPKLAHSDDPDVQRIMKSAKRLSFPAHERISSSGSLCEYYILVMSGSLRVQILTENGREVVLYHVRPGEGCTLTTSCLLSGEPFPAEGITESTVKVLALSAAEFDTALQKSTLFRRFVFTQLGQRLADVISRVEQVCSHSIERHLAEILLTMNNGGAGINTTHQDLASELGTAREVVSRHLKRFETNGWIRLGRGTIQLDALDVLARISQKKMNRKVS